MNDRLTQGVRIVLGGVFLYAGITKVLDPAGFAVAVYNYRILPGELVNIAALVLPWVEVILGVCLIAGWWLPGAAALTSILFITFTAALAFNAARGLDINCGCFSTRPDASEQTSVSWYIVRDLSFLVISIYLFMQSIKRGPEENS